MDRGITIIISIVVGVAAMGGVAIFGFDVLSGSTVGTNIIPKSLDIVSSDAGKSIQISVALTNQGTGSIASVGAVLRADVKEQCVAAKGNTKPDCGTTFTRSNKNTSPDTGVIYFPVSYSDQVVESYGTINIRGSIETNGSIPKLVGCNEDLPTDTPATLGTRAAGFSTLDKALDYVSGSGKMLKDKTIGNTGSSANAKVATNDVLCALDLGIFAGEEMILTVIATTTSGDTIEKIIPITVK